MLAPYRAIGIPIVLTSAESGTGLDDLRRVIGGRRCVFVGHSGVGKSSLLNAIDPHLRLTTKRISEGTNRGSTLDDIVDALPRPRRRRDHRHAGNPAVRALGLEAGPNLRWYFPEFSEHSDAAASAIARTRRNPSAASNGPSPEAPSRAPATTPTGGFCRPWLSDSPGAPVAQPVLRTCAIMQGRCRSEQATVVREPVRLRGSRPARSASRAGCAE